jgi:hypothetical protein
MMNPLAAQYVEAHLADLRRDVHAYRIAAEARHDRPRRRVPWLSAAQKSRKQGPMPNSSRPRRSPAR